MMPCDGCNDGVRAALLGFVIYGHGHRRGTPPLKTHGQPPY
jgi:hypothetical protein